MLLLLHAIVKDIYTCVCARVYLKVHIHTDRQRKRTGEENESESDKTHKMIAKKTEKEKNMMFPSK